jgi:hypothetical protein
MPISGLLIRIASDSEQEVARTLERLREVAGLSLGEPCDAAAPAVLDALDYDAHDSALAAAMADPGVWAVDVVFHDFSDVSFFDRLPARNQR